MSVGNGICSGPIAIWDAITKTFWRIESNGGAAVNIQDQHTRSLNLKFIQSSGLTTLTANTVFNNRVISVAAVTGMAQGKVIGIVNPNGQFYFGEVVSISVLDVTLDTPLDQVFDYTTSTVIVADKHLKVDGSVTPQIFQIAGVGAGTGVDIDITRIMGGMTGATIMYDELFGNLPALTNGCVFRTTNGVTTNQWNVKTNGDLALLCFDASYPPKVPSGSYAFRFRNSYAGPEKHGVTLRLEPGDTLEVIIQDDLTGLTDFQMMAQGHVVGD